MTTYLFILCFSTFLQIWKRFEIVSSARVTAPSATGAAIPGHEATVVLAKKLFFSQFSGFDQCVRKVWELKTVSLELGLAAHSVKVISEHVGNKIVH